MFEGKKILVVDDEPDLREITAFEFEYKGAEVITADGGKEALEIVQDDEIDLVISDVRMPNGSGEELLANLRAQNLLEKSPLILMTGFSDVSRDEAKKRGALELFHKPVKWTEIIDFVNDVFQAR